MGPFLKKFFPKVYRREELNVGGTNQYCKFDDAGLTMFTSSLYLAALVASLCASSITRALGRKVSMLVGGILFLAGALFNGLAQNVAMLIIGRLLLGFGVGFANQVLQPFFFLLLFLFFLRHRLLLSKHYYVNLYINEHLMVLLSIFQSQFF